MFAASKIEIEDRERKREREREGKRQRYSRVEKEREREKERQRERARVIGWASKGKEGRVREANTSMCNASCMYITMPCSCVCILRVGDPALKRRTQNTPTPIEKLRNEVIQYF